MPAPVADEVVVGTLSPIDDKAVSVSSDQAIKEGIHHAVGDEEVVKDSALVLDTEIKPGPPAYDGDYNDQSDDNEDVIIITGADAAKHLLSLRDDGQPTLTFRSIFLATILSAFQAVMSQIYTVS